MAAYDGSIRIDSRIDESGFNQGISNMSASAKKLGLVLLAAFSVEKIIEFGKASSDAATGLESSMKRVNFIFGEANQSIINFAETSAFSIGMSRKAAYDYAATFGNLFQSIASSAQENAEITKKYLGMSAVVSSSTGRTMEDVMDRIRSGLLGSTEAIEDLGIQVGVNAISMTESFKMIADGRSWEKLNFQEQQQVRMLAILEQAHKKYGTEVMTGSAFTKQQFSAAMENMKVSVGSVLNVAIIPMVTQLTKFVSLLNTLFVAVFGKGIEVQSNFAKSGDKASTAQGKLAENTTKAAKAAKGALAAFDELNILQKETGQAAGTAPVAATGAGMATTPTATTMKPPEIKLPEGFEKVASKLKGLAESFSYLGDQVIFLWDKTGLKELILKISDNVLSAALDALTGIVYMLAGAIEVLSGGLLIIKAFFIGDTKTLIEGFTMALKGLGDMIYGVLIAMLGKDAADAIKTFVTTWASNISKWWTTDVVPWFKVEKWQELWANVKSAFVISWKLLMDWWGINAMAKWWVDHVAPWFTVKKWSDLYLNVKTGFSTGWGKIVEWWNTSGPVVWWEKNVTPWFTTKKWTDMLTNVSNAFTNVFNSIGENIQTTIKNAINGIIENMNSMIDAWNSIKFEIPSIVPGIGGTTIGVPQMPHIPKLANGAVIAPNMPFLAMLGDQPSGLNIETPLETMLEAFRGALSEMGGTSQGGTVVLNLDGKTLGRAILPSIDAARKQRGVNLVLGSV